MIRETEILPLELRDVSFRAGGKRLIKDFSCKFEKGSRTTIIGPNGAGKSLLLRICHGLLKPSAGRVLWAGPGGQDAKLQQAMVFQRPVMLRRSVYENIKYALTLHKIKKSEHKNLIEGALHLAGLGRLKDHPARILSFGEQQKLALVRVWALQPQVLFLDEPSASLDPASTHAIEDIIQTIHDRGTRIIMTTHDLGQAKRIGDEVMFLNRGRLLEKSPTKQFFKLPKNDLAQAFIRGELLWWRLGKDNQKSKSTPQKN